MSSRRTNNIKVLSERLRSLQITEEASSKYKQTEIDKMSNTPAPVVAMNENVQAEMIKNIVLDLGWFNGDQMKFEDWWREMRLFLKSNRVMETNDRITVILAHLRGGVAGIYAQRKLNKLDKETGTQDWEEFVWEIKTMFSDKTKAADAK